MVNLPSAGSPNWDVPLNTALAQMAHAAFTPAESNMIIWNFDPMHMTAGTGTTSGTVRTIRLPRLTQNATITNIHFQVQGLMAGGVSGQNFVGLYNAVGNRVAVSADITTALGSAGVKTIPLTSPYNAAPGTYFVAILQNATTPATLGYASNNTSSGPNAGLTGSLARFADNPTGQTGLPGTIDLSDRFTAANAQWVALS